MYNLSFHRSVNVSRLKLQPVKRSGEAKSINPTSKNLEFVAFTDAFLPLSEQTSNKYINFPIQNWLKMESSRPVFRRRLALAVQLRSRLFWRGGQHKH
jgi:hypothetical protein